jgi:ABC-type sugar transport system substrate-binding protein
VTNIVLDQERGIRSGLEHLHELGHRNIAFMKGQPFSSDSEERWKAVCEVTQDLGLEMNPDLVVHLEIDDPSPQLGYPYAKQLLARKQPFTALFAYNDIAAIGAIVPEKKTSSATTVHSTASTRARRRGRANAAEMVRCVRVPTGYGLRTLSRAGTCSNGTDISAGVKDP